MIRYKGFTLIEVMIVVAIIAIIAAIALPNYSQYVLRTHRADAQRVLLETAAEMERQRVILGSYPTSLPTISAELNADRFVWKNTNSENKSTLSATAFTLIVEPKGAQGKDSCEQLTLNHLGAQGGKGANCW